MKIDISFHHQNWGRTSFTEMRKMDNFNCFCYYKPYQYVIDWEYLD